MIIVEIMNINIVWITCDICVFHICRSDNLNYNIYPLVIVILHKNTRNTFSNTVRHIFLQFNKLKTNKVLFFIHILPVDIVSSVTSGCFAQTCFININKII